MTKKRLRIFAAVFGFLIYVVDLKSVDNSFKIVGFERCATN